MNLAAEPIDSRIRVTTPEYISFQYAVAGPFRRAPAFIADLVVRGVMYGLFVTFLTILASSFDFAGAGLFGGIGLATWFLLDWFYGAFFEAVWNGQTPGKRMFRLRVLTTQGRPISAVQALLRNIVRWVDVMPFVPLFIFGPDVPFFFPIFLVGFLSAGLTKKSQRLGDLVSGTMVVVADDMFRIGGLSFKDPRVLQAASIIPSSLRISHGVARALAIYAERRRRLAPARREEIAARLAKPLRQRVDFPPEASHDLFLCAVYQRLFAGTQEEALQPRQSPAPVLAEVS